MTEPLPPKPTQAMAEPVAYQPISGWAIAGFAIGSLFTLMVGICTVVALRQGAPVFFPIWMMGMAVLGVALSLYGQRHVQNSEGTRAGAKLARIGMWLGLVSGLTYFSYYFVTGLALQSQANAFLMEKGVDSGFFPLLREGVANPDDPTQLNAAFLLTLPPTGRGGRPHDEKNMREHYDAPNKDGAPGNLSAFRESALPRIFYKDLGKEAEITPMAVLEWKYEQRSYKIYRAYRIKTKELEYDTMLAVMSMEGESAGQGRKWFVNVRESAPIAKRFTPLGDGMKLLRQQATEWLGQKINSLTEGASFPTFKDVDKTRWDVLTVDEDKRRPEYRAQILQAFTGAPKPRLNQFQVFTRPDEPGKWEQSDGKIRLYLVFGVNVHMTLDQLPFYKVEGIVGLESKQAIDPARFDSASARPDWTLVNVVFTTVTTMKGPG